MFLWWIPWISDASKTISWTLVCLLFTLTFSECKSEKLKLYDSNDIDIPETSNRTLVKHVILKPTIISDNSIISEHAKDFNHLGTRNEKQNSVNFHDSIFYMPNVNISDNSVIKKIQWISNFYNTIFLKAIKYEYGGDESRRNTTPAKSKLRNEFRLLQNSETMGALNNLFQKHYSRIDKVEKTLNLSPFSLLQNRRKTRSINEYKLASPSNPAGLNVRSDSIINLGPGLPRRSKEPPLEDKEGMGGSALNPSTNSNHQRFATQPAPQTAVIGSTVVLPCRVMRKVGHLQWTKDGFGLGTDRKLLGFSRYSMIGSDDEGDFTLRIHPVLLQDDALFQCQVSASDGVPGIQTKPVRLTVYVPPDAPEVVPPKLETTAGITVELQCLSKGGRPASEIQWVDDHNRENIQLGATDSVVPMEDGKRTIVTSKLTFTPRRHHNNQTITCLASNQALSSPLSASIKLHVFFPPDVTLTSHPDVFVEGDDATFYCDSVANPSAVSYKWFHNTQEMMNETLRVLKLFKISRDFHQDSISCEVLNKVGASKKTKTIYVRYRPTFRVLPKDVRAEIASTVNLVCDVDSNPVATIVWMKLGSNKIIGTGASLPLQVTPVAAGVYKCFASVRGRDFEFPKLEGTVQVLVKGPPKIVSKSEQQGRMGDTVSLECSTVSVPSPIRVTWTYKGKGINLGDPRYSIITDEKEMNHRNVLVIHDAGSTDFGDYNCSVVNEYGVARKLITLKQEQRIPVLLVVGLVVAIIVIAVVVVSLVFCNKSHPNVKATTEPEKDKYDESFTPITNMYSAPSDTKLDDSSIGTPHQVPLADVKVAPVPPKRTFAKDDTSLAFNMRQPNVNGFSSPTQAQRETMKNDYSTFMESLAATGGGEQRPSLTNASLYFQRVSNSEPPHPVSPGATEFCTIRRTPRNIKNSVLNECQMTDSKGLRPVNGNLETGLNRRSAFIPHTYSPPPPPPYPRTNPSLMVASDGSGDSKREFFEGDGASSNEEAKYIFSSEAMLKPGTLV